MTDERGFEITVKLHLYDTIARSTRVPTVAEVASDLDREEDTVREAFRLLGRRRLLVLEPESGEIRMAPPFSAIATPHRARIGSNCYFANCIWDAFGIAAALSADAEILSTCGDCGEPLVFRVSNGEVEAAEGVVHYAVPAARWWEDIVYT